MPKMEYALDCCNERLGHVEMLVDFSLELITHCLGIAQKHGGVLLIKYWVVCTSISCAHGALHYNHRLALPHLRTKQR